MRRAPSSTTISTFSARFAPPVLRTTTCPVLLGFAVITVCAARGAEPRPLRAIVMATGSTPATVIARARSVLVQAFADARSSGTPAEPTRESPRSIHSTVAPSTGGSSSSYAVPSSAPSIRSRTSATGVCFQSTSWPVTAGKSSWLTEVNRPERVWTGTLLVSSHPPSLCALAPCCSEEVAELPVLEFCCVAIDI